MSITRRTLLAGAAGTLALSTLPTIAEAGVTNTILPAPIPQGGIGGQTEIHCTTPVVLASGMCIAIGGSFDALRLPNGTTVAASNAAIVRLSDHKVMWAGSGINSYVDSVAAVNGIIYWGGRFTTFSGQARDRLAAITTAGTLTPWNPRLGSRARSLAFYGSSIFVAGDHLWAVEDARSNKVGRTLWKREATTGDVRTLLVHNNSLYVGGLFEKLAGRTEKIVRLSFAGNAHTAFNPPFRPDDWRGKPVTSYDGDCILSLAAYPGGRLLVGTGGGGRNGLFVLDQNYGNVIRKAGWSYVYRSRSGVYSPPPQTDRMQRNSEGDVQAVAVCGSEILMGYHRGHVNYNTDWKTKRMLTSWTQSTGRVNPLDPGFWGGNANTSGANGGVQTLTYLPTQKVLVVGGCFRGTGDPYNNTGGSDIYGTAGAYRAALTYLKVA